MANFAEGDRERWAEEVLVTLLKATDRNGLKVFLSPEHTLSVLAFAMAMVVGQQQSVADSSQPIKMDELR